MHNKKLLILLIVMLLVCLVALVACKDKNVEPEEEMTVTFDEWEVVELPTENETGSIRRKGSDGKEYTFELPSLGNDIYIVDELKKPSCEEDGEVQYTITAVDKTFSFVVKTPMIGHDYSVEYEWAKDHSSCTALMRCANDQAHNEIVVATITSEITTQPTCVSDGVTTYTATFDADWAKPQRLEVANIEALGHEFGETTYENVANQKCIATRTCKRCLGYTERANAIFTSEITTQPTCNDYGERTYTAVFAEEWAETQTKKEMVRPLDHDWNETEYIFSEDLKTCTAKRVCKRDASHFNVLTANVTNHISKLPTFDAMGDTTYSASFAIDWAYTEVPVTKVITNIPMYTLSKVEGKAATCTEKGLKEYWAGSNGVNYEDEAHTKPIANIDTWKIIPATGHDWSVSYNWNDELTACEATRVCANNSAHNMTANATISSVVEGSENVITATFDNDWTTKQEKRVSNVTLDDEILKIRQAYDATCIDFYDIITNGTFTEQKAIIETAARVALEKLTLFLPKPINIDRVAVKKNAETKILGVYVNKNNGKEVDAQVDISEEINRNIMMYLCGEYQFIDGKWQQTASTAEDYINEEIRNSMCASAKVETSYLNNTIYVGITHIMSSYGINADFMQVDVNGHSRFSTELAKYCSETLPNVNYCEKAVLVFDGTKFNVTIITNYGDHKEVKGDGYINIDTSLFDGKIYPDGMPFAENKELNRLGVQYTQGIKGLLLPFRIDITYDRSTNSYTDIAYDVAAN